MSAVTRLVRRLQILTAEAVDGIGDRVMGENGKKHWTAHDIIVAFDRERAEAHEHHRRHMEWKRRSRERDRIVTNERQRKQQ
jgi:hypothetical protein